MSAERPTWRDRYPEQVTCVRCLEVKDVEDLDRLLWCDACRSRARNRATWWGWLVGAVIAACVAAYIWGVIHPSNLILGGWIATVVAALWLGAKVGREISYGVMRFRNSRATDAVPPSSER
jgi:hypothetical protein